MSRSGRRGILPRSLLGQVMLALAIGLLIGQAVSAVLLYRAAEQRRDAGMVNAIAFRIVARDDLRDRFDRRGPRERDERRGERPPRRPRLFDDARGAQRLRVEETDVSPLLPGETRLPRFERALADILAAQEVTAQQVVVIRRKAGEDPFILARPRLQARFADPRWERRPVIVAGVKRADRTGWQVVRLPEARAPGAVLGTILLQTLVIFTVLFVLLYFLMRRITRPLARLTRRVDEFARNPDRPAPIEESGPQDIRELIGAHNAMEGRIAAMLDEKDVMLGAIGHDLKTPLAALRVRIESVPDEAQRARMAATIEDITHTLDDILNLARVGRASDPLERTDLAALAASVVAEYEDMGEPVDLVEGPRVVAPVRATWLRRAIRNLVGNALRYGKRATVRVEREGDNVLIRIEDEGPGIPRDQIAAMMEPFQRGEASRNRATGGAGLGLTLARAIAEQHGGTLALSNRDEGGLRAEIRLPL